MRRRLVTAVLAAVLCLATSGAAAAQAPPATPAPLGTPVLGASLLTADQMAAWYASTGITSRSPAPIADLAASFAAEGAAQGVRGDIAFAQSMLETGYLRYGGIVRPTDLNFSGLGACDSCVRGLAFPSAEAGVRAQIQHLYAYAAPGADPAALARPLADVRFGNVRPAGRAPLWESMGNGNWATGPDYARKVLTIWQAMLTWAGIPAPAPVAAGGTPDLTVRASPDGAVRVGGWRTRQSPVADAVTRLGAPSSLRRAGGVCLLRWRALGAAVLVGGPGDPCAVGTATLRWARLAGTGWHTHRGLHAGDPASRIRELYPRARHVAGRWVLVEGREAGRRRPVARLRVEVSAGVVRALWVQPSRI